MAGLAAAALVLAAGTLWITSVGARPARADTPSAPSCASSTDITTDSGPICGLTVSGTNEWLGIPYAAPPVGALRWQPPQAPTPWTTTLQATQFGSECSQGAATPPAGSENCLFVNVWAPADASTGLPVLVHIHGGGFVGGSGNGDNSLLSSTGHEVVVSLNYRLGIFGFLADKALGNNSGDYGLEDQQAALQWVQHNIAAFGGDPKNVTIYGESAGGSSVCDEIASPTAKGLFERGISVSGEYNTLLGAPNSLEQQDCKSQVPTKAQAFAAGKNFAAAVGCPKGDTSAAADCLRNISATTAQTVAGGGVAGGFFPVGYQDGGQGTVGPTINGTTLTMTLRQALASGDANHVQVIAGTDRDENLVGTATTAAQYQALVDTQYGSFASQVEAKYPLSHFDNPGVAWRTVAADSDTVCPSLQTAQDLAARMPTREYEIDDNDIPPYRASGPGVVAPGASHVGAWFLTPQATPLDANQQVLQNQELAFVTGFARNGNPNVTGTPAWPKLNNSDEVMSLQPAGDSELVTTAQMEAEHKCAFWDRVAKSAP